MSERETKKFVCSYYHDGGRWGLEIHAYDWADAEARCKKLGLTLDGEYIVSIPAKVGYLARYACWLRNFITNPHA